MPTKQFISCEATVIARSLDALIVTNLAAWRTVSIAMVFFSNLPDLLG